MTPRERLAILHKAIRTIEDAIPKHVHPEPKMTANEFKEVDAEETIANDG